MFDRRTAENLKSGVFEELSKYEVVPGQIYSVTTDNRANIVNALTLATEPEFPPL